MRIRSSKILAVFTGIVVIFLGASSSRAAVKNVGKSACAYRTIQAAIDAAAQGDTVLVHDGVYVERIDFKGKAVAVLSVNGPQATVIDGDMKGSVVTVSGGEGAGTVLKGFTITNGRSAAYGGGVYCNNSSPSLANCTIKGNYAAYHGGGIYCFNSSPSVTNCVISGNKANFGGGVCCYGASSPAITDCTVSGNAVSNGGGGIYCNGSSPAITNCAISGNSAEEYSGGGISCDNSSSPSIADCVISGNFSLMYGGGIHSANSSPSVARCAISGNIANLSGGGIYGEHSSPTIANCIISGNAASLYHGGGIFLDDSSPAISSCAIRGNSALFYGGGICCFASSAPCITNCVISGNGASNSGGGIYGEASFSIANCTISGNSSTNGGGINVFSGFPTVVNSILWGDSATNGPEVRLGGGAITIAFSDVQGGWTGASNIDADPLFLDPRPISEVATSAGDYRLRTGSPCIDAGTGDSAAYPCIIARDLAGDPRPQGAGYDIGADEAAILVNGSFEEVAERVPVPWIGTALAADDGRVTTRARQSRASFLMNGAAASKQLAQSRNIAGLAGDVLDFSCWHAADTASVYGGFFGVTLTVQYADGSRNTVNLAFPKSTHGWQRGRQTFTALKPYTKVTLALVYAGQRGSAWFDDVKLSVLRP